MKMGHPVVKSVKKETAMLFFFGEKSFKILLHPRNVRISIGKRKLSKIQVYFQNPALWLWSGVRVELYYVLG